MRDRAEHGEIIRRVARERTPPGDELVEHDAERPDVDSVIDVGLAARLLGRHVVRCAEERAGARERTARFGESRDAEVDDFRLHAPVLVARQENILRLHVAMNDSAAVRHREPVDDRQDELDGLDRSHLRLPRHQVGKRLAGEELHDDERALVVGLPEVEHAHDGRMSEPSRGARFSEEPFVEACRVGLLIVDTQHFDRDVDVEELIVRDPHGSHRARADLSHQAIATTDEIVFAESLRQREQGYGASRHVEGPNYG